MTFSKVSAHTSPARDIASTTHSSRMLTRRGSTLTLIGAPFEVETGQCDPDCLPLRHDWDDEVDRFHPWLGGQNLFHHLLQGVLCRDDIANCRGIGSEHFECLAVQTEPV